MVNGGFKTIVYGYIVLDIQSSWDITIYNPHKYASITTDKWD